MSHTGATSSEFSESDSDEQLSPEQLIKIIDGTEDMQMILEKIKDIIKSFNVPPFIDESFVISMVESDITSNIEFFKIVRQDDIRILVLIDPLNGLYLPFDRFISIIVPTYISIQLRTAFSELTSIRTLLNEITANLQEEIERITLAVSEEEFKEAKFNKKDITAKELSDILKTKTISEKQSEPLEDCPLCGEESVTHYYECVNCHYKYCAKCCEEIASRQALCPCCREELSLTEHHQ